MSVAAFHVRPASLFSAVGPFLALGVLAFLAGFGGYLILGPAKVLSPATGAARMTPAPAAAPAAMVVMPTTDDLNPPKPV